MRGKSLLGSGLAVLAAWAWTPSYVSAADLHGRVIDLATLGGSGNPKGVPGVRVVVYEGKRRLGTAVTNSKGGYRLRKVPSAEVKAVYLARRWHPSQTIRLYGLDPADSASRDVFVYSAPRQRPRKGAKGASRNAPDPVEAYYARLARGFLEVTGRATFFRENDADSLVDLSSYFDARDTTAAYRCAMLELLWADFLAQDHPLESRYCLAAALKPLVDSLRWNGLQGMEPYLEADPAAVGELAAALREALRDPRKLPGPRDARKLKVPADLVSRLAGEALADPGLSEKAKDRFLAQWKKAWGRETPAFGEDEDGEGFRPAGVIGTLAAAHPRNATLQYLKGRGLFSAHDFARAVDALEDANRLAEGHTAARYLEAVALMRLGRDQEALGRFQALRESPDPHWKAKGLLGAGTLAEKEGRHSEAASALWKSVRIEPDPEAIDLLASVSLNLTERAEMEKLLARRAEAEDARAHFWLGRYAEADQQAGVALDHYRKAWELSPAPPYAEALARLNIAREEYAPALALLEPLRARLSPAGRIELAECLFQAGRSLDAAKDFKSSLDAEPNPQVLARYVEALLRANRGPEALAAAQAFPDQGAAGARFALARAYIGNHQPAKARPILEALARQEDDNPDFHHYLGLCHYEDRNWSKAKREFDEALKYRQDHLEALYYTGLCGVKMGRADAARNYFNELAQRASPEWKAKGFLGVGIAFAAQGKPEAAENFFTRSLLVVESAEARALLALSKRRLGDPEKWIPLAQKAYAMDNHEPKAVLAMGEALLAQGKRREALKHYRDATADDPNSCELLAGLAKAQNLAGDYEGGRASSDKAISLCPQEPEGYYSAGMASDKAGNRSEAKDFFKAYRKAGGDVALLPEDYR